ncbi:uncharacterized protein SRS1_16514 [Sporisorium reilianum f. sp. reilianum]|uniref:Uncharacterized protein n=1 Tax=Sporisorium reilianum f. sp. reilianum TaxID=72559 RepID=A0A2N8UMD9_9BASI|nr:uncharacterized protein SRS1_16514 [Sporisorium reilianum f. sp. reilianum]
MLNTSTASFEGDAGPAGVVAAKAADDQHATSTRLSLPPEIWQRIIDLLLPANRPEHNVYPQPNFKSVNHRAECICTSHRDLAALALCCRQLHPLATQALYAAPFLSTPRKVSCLARSLSRNDDEDEGKAQGAQTCLSAQAVRALHVKCQLTGDTKQSTKVKRARASDVGVLLSCVDDIRYLSLEISEGRKSKYDDAEDAEDADEYEADKDHDDHNDDDNADDDSDEYDDDSDNEEHDEDNHPLIRLLSASTKCRLRGLRYRAEKDIPNASLARATSFAPLSRLTHLELARKLPSQDLIAFVLGAPRLAPSQLKVAEAIAAGLSPNSTLECLRFSDSMGTLMIRGFAEYAAERQFSGPEAFSFRHDAAALEVLYSLATHSTNLPSLRLLIIEVRSGVIDVPLELLKQLKRSRVLKKAYTDFPPLADGSDEYGDSSLASVFSTSIRDHASGDRSLEAAISAVDPSWQEHFRATDEYWRQVHQGKHALQRLWNDARVRAGLAPTEIRLVADRFGDYWDESECNFRCQAAGVDGAARGSSSDVGVWADADVFELVETQPWLSYFQLARYGCCSWSGALPRDSNPGASGEDEGGKTRRIVVPQFVRLERRTVDEQEGQDGGEDGGGLKRQRTEENAVQEAGTS